MLHRRVCHYEPRPLLFNMAPRNEGVPACRPCSFPPCVLAACVLSLHAFLLGFLLHLCAAARRSQSSLVCIARRSSLLAAESLIELAAAETAG
jgi:hypothetical protein